MIFPVVLPFCKDVHCSSSLLTHCFLFGFIIWSACVFQKVVPFLPLSEELGFLRDADSPQPPTSTRTRQKKTLCEFGRCFFPPSNRQTNLNCGDKHKVEGNVSQIEDSLASHAVEQSHPASAERWLRPIKGPVVSRLKRLCCDLIWKSCLCRQHLGKKVALSFQLGVEGVSLAVEFYQCFLKPRLSSIHSPARVWLHRPQTGPARQPEVCTENLIPLT